MSDERNLARAEIWSAEGSRWSGRTGSLQCEVAPLDGGGPLVVVKRGADEVGSLDRVRLASLGNPIEALGALEAAPIVDETYVAHDSLIARVQFAHQAKLTLIERFQVTETGFTLELRLQTVLPIDFLALETRFHWSSGWERRAAHPLRLSSANGPTEDIAVHVDVGEEGTLKIEERQASYSMFRRPLEKGVILVGRWGIESAPSTLLDEQWDRLGRQWLNQRAFL